MDRTRVRGPYLFGKIPAMPFGGGGGASNEVLAGSLLTANFNITTDQAITLAGQWRITRVQTTNASVSMTTAAGGFYTGAGKTATIIVPAAQVYTGMVTAANVVVCALNYGVNVTTLFFALTTAQGVAATADVYVYGVRIV